MTGSLSLGNTNLAGVTRKIVVPSSAGGTSDVLGRRLAESLAKASDSSFIVENIAGASGTIAANMVLRQRRDGATLLLGNSGLICSTPLLMHGESVFDPQADFVPICTVADAPFLLFARGGFPANNLAELQGLYKGNKGKLTYASSEAGTGNHLAGEVILGRLGLQSTHVPYRGGSQAVIDIIEGRVEVGVFGYQNIASFLANGKVKVLCTLSDSPLEVLPQIRTVMDQGFGKFDIQGWNALFVASGTPEPIVQEYEGRVKSIFDQGDIQAYIKRMGNTPSFRDHKNSRVFVGEEIHRYRNLLRQYRLIGI